MNTAPLLHRRLLRQVLGLVVAAWLTGLATWASAQSNAIVDPPGRVGRLAQLRGSVSWFDLEDGRWQDAVANRPLTTGDRVATGRDAQAELRIGSTSLKLGEGTEIELLRVDDERVRVQLHRGTMALRIRAAALAAETDVGTAEAWLLPQQAGLLRVERQDDTTWVTAWRGEVRVDGEPHLQLGTGQRLQLWRDGPGAALRHRVVTAPDDAFAARILREDREEARGRDPAPVSTEMTGYEELDRHGRWDEHPELGPVWMPSAVADDWVPYRHGRWAWVRPWGWTWIDDAPWGFAPFHYGRWAHWRNRWVWVPGPYVARPVFAPALVAWLDGPSVGIGLRVGGPTFSWVPLAPWEPFVPYYRTSPGYRDRIHPPDRRWRPPARGDGYSHQRVTGAVTIVDADRVPRPRPPRLGIDEPRPSWLDRDRTPRPGTVPDRTRDRESPRDRDPGRDHDRERDRARPPAPPPPTRLADPLPSRPQPVQPGPARHPDVHRPVPPPPPPPPVTSTTPPPARPAPIVTRPEGPAARPQTPPPRAPKAPEPPPRERDKDKAREQDRDEGRGRGAQR